MKEGFILKGHAGNYFVYCEGKTIMCRARGKFRIEGTSPLAGDNVIIDEVDNYLLKIKPRQNYLIRPPVANVEQIIIIASLFHPDCSLALINRFMTMAIMYGIKPVLAISKIDLLAKDDPRLLLLKKAYQGLNYQIIYFSNKTGEGIDDVMNAFKGHRSVIMGQSGVGKSSLINRLIPQQKQETNEISKALGRGKHITRVVEFLPYQDGWVADTPGFSLIDIDLTPIQLANCYPGFEDLFDKCKYRNCLHDQVNGCAVYQAVQQGIIDQDHYVIYLSMLQELKNKKERY